MNALPNRPHVLLAVSLIALIQFLASVSSASIFSFFTKGKTEQVDHVEFSLWQKAHFYKCLTMPNNETGRTTVHPDLQESLRNGILFPNALTLFGREDQNYKDCVPTLYHLEGAPINRRHILQDQKVLILAMCYHKGKALLILPVFQSAESCQAQLAEAFKEPHYSCDGGTTTVNPIH